jgi:hypothetical protein
MLTAPKPCVSIVFRSTAVVLFAERSPKEEGDRPFSKITFTLLRSAGIAQKNHIRLGVAAQHGWAFAVGRPMERIDVLCRKIGNLLSRRAIDRLEPEVFDFIDANATDQRFSVPPAGEYCGKKFERDCVELRSSGDSMEATSCGTEGALCNGAPVQNRCGIPKPENQSNLNTIYPPITLGENHASGRSRQPPTAPIRRHFIVDQATQRGCCVS